jgi:abortive infection bacteriophage resistance protein
MLGMNDHYSIKGHEQYLQYQTSIGIPLNFLDGLPLEDDWSFVIKTSAILESAVTNVLTKKLGFNKISDWISKLEHSERLNALRKLSIVDKKEHRIFTKILEIRNKIAHHTEYINFKFETYFDAEHIGTDANNTKDWKNLFIDIATDHLNFVISDLTPEEYIHKEPKQCINAFTKEILIKFHTEIVEIEENLKDNNI